jgi:hypothetical protein
MSCSSRIAVMACVSLAIAPGALAAAAPDYSTPTPPPRPRESALHFSGEKQKVAAVIESLETAYRQFDAARICVDLNIAKPAAAIGDAQALRDIPKCEKAIRRGHRRGTLKTGHLDLAVTSVRIACLDQGTDELGADACAAVHLVVTERGKKSRTRGTLVRVAGSWYFAYFGRS